MAETTVTTTPTPLAPAVVADDWPRQILAIVTIVQFLALVGLVIWLNRPVDNALMMILGAEIGFVTIVLQYYYGSSSGSTRKDNPPSQPVPVTETVVTPATTAKTTTTTDVVRP